MQRSWRDGPSGNAGSDHSGQEEERWDRRGKDQGPAASQSATDLLRGHAANPGTATDAAIPQPDGVGSGADEKSHQWAADGDRGRVQPTAVTRQEVFQRPDGGPAGSARFGATIVAAEPGG